MADVVDIAPWIAARARHPDGAAFRRLRMVSAEHVDLLEMSEELGTSEQWIAAAIAHLQAEIGDQTGGAVKVSAAALHLVLVQLERLEARRGRAQ